MLIRSANTSIPCWPGQRVFGHRPAIALQAVTRQRTTRVVRVVVQRRYRLLAKQNSSLAREFWSKPRGCTVTVELLGVGMGDPRGFKSELGVPKARLWQDPCAQPAQWAVMPTPPHPTCPPRPAGPRSHIPRTMGRDANPAPLHLYAWYSPYMLGTPRPRSHIPRRPAGASRSATSGSGRASPRSAARSLRPASRASKLRCRERAKEKRGKTRVALPRPAAKSPRPTSAVKPRSPFCCSRRP